MGELNRRKFIKLNSVVGIGATYALHQTPVRAFEFLDKVNQQPAILGGNPVVDHDWPDWPIWNPETDEKRLLEVMRSGVWSRKNVTQEFEQKWAELIGSKIPVFADIDPKTFQIDPAKIEEKITDRTRAILPVHILGLPCDMDPIMDIARRHNLVVVEDACQAWLAEYDGKKAGTFGNAGCFSFQNSKNIPIGEGGAIVSDDDAFMDRCFSYHNYGMPYGSVKSDRGGAVMSGTKLRITEYQCAIGLAQLERLDEQTDMRSENAAYLSAMIREVPGITPYELYSKVTRASFHLYPFRYDQREFKGLPRAKFLSALSAEGIPCSSGYIPLNKMPYLENAFNSKNFKKFYGEKELNIDRYNEENECPLNDKLCYEEAVWLPQYVLLGSRRDMESIRNAIGKIHANAEKLKNS